MIFQNLRLKEKIWLLLFLSLLFCWWLFFAPGTCSASEPMYQITEMELATLENNLRKLEQLSSTQKTELTRLQEQLTKSEQELALLKSQLATSSTQLTQAQNSLQTANELLDKFVQEEKKKRLKIKAQRNTYFTLMVAATIAAVCHR